jgi:hypothetical protein
MKIVTLILCLGLCLASFAQSEDYIQLDITDVKVTENSSEAAGIGGIINLKNKSNLNNVQLYQSSNLSITADIKVSSNNSRRSSTKSGSITLDVVYHTNYSGKKDKRTAQYIFYLDDDRSFVAKEQFVFKNGLKPRQIKLSYKGRFRD